MGEYLSKPDKNKTTENGENSQVSKHIFCYIQALFLITAFLRFDSLQRVCKAGVALWKTHTSQTLTSETDSPYSAFSMDMEVAHNLPLIWILFIGQEVALYVKKHYTKILTNLQSFK